MPTSDLSHEVVCERLVRVMLIEDSPVIRDALTEALAATPCLTFAATAASAPDAIACLRREAFDLLVIDLELKEGTGFDVLYFLAREGQSTQPVRVVLTNHAYPVYEQRARGLGVEHFFDKSMQFDAAIAQIEAEAHRLSLAA
ncbi:response regulator [Chitinibacteraceae bacterium HSL-7]